MKKNPFSLAFTIGITLLGVGIVQESVFIISISQDLDLWWEVIQRIDKNSYNLVLAYIMGFVGLVLVASGIVLTVTRDRKLDNFS